MILLDGARYDRIEALDVFGKWHDRGTIFSKMITYGPQTVMALHALFSGINGNLTGANNYFSALKFKKDSCKTLPQYLKEKGYDTHADVLQDIVLPKKGFDEITIHDEHKDDVTKVHLDLIKRKSRVDKEGKSFFLFLQYSPIHTNMIENVLKKYNYDDYNKKYFGNTEENTKNYDLKIKEAKRYLDQIFEMAKDEGLLDKTVFIIFSDHGSSVGEKPGELGYGRFCYDYTIKSFVFFSHPKIFPSKKVDKVCRIIDIFPTIADILNLNKDPNFMEMQGKSLIPLMGNESDERIAFSEASGIEKKPTNRDPYIKSVRDKNWKLIYNTNTKIFELYNLSQDSQENKNLFNVEKDKAKEMLKKMSSLSPEIENLFYSKDSSE